MIFQLPNGKCIEISVEYYLSMSDDELQQFVAINAGFSTTDPFTTSILKNGESRRVTIDESDFEDRDKDYSRDDSLKTMQDISFDEKISDPDFFNKDEH